MKKVNAFFQSFIDQWPAQAGPVPTGDQFNAAVALTVALSNGRSAGLGIEALNLAMCLRKGGASVAQYLFASRASGAAHNKRRAVIMQGYCTGGQLPGGIGNARAYTLVLTAKGEAAVKSYNAGNQPKASKPVVAKPVAPVKPKAPRKPKAKPVAPPVEVPQPVEAAPTETQAA